MRRSTRPEGEELVALVGRAIAVFVRLGEVPDPVAVGVVYLGWIVGQLVEVVDDPVVVAVEVVS